MSPSTHRWPPPTEPDERLLLRGYALVHATSAKSPLVTTCCQSRRFYMRRRGAVLNVRCASCGSDEVVPVETFETGQPMSEESGE